MSLEVLLLGCYVMLIVCAAFLFKLNQRHANSFKLYGEALANLQVIEKQKLDELKMIRLTKQRQLVETQRLTANIRRAK